MDVCVCRVDLERGLVWVSDLCVGESRGKGLVCGCFVLCVHAYTYRHINNWDTHLVVQGAGEGDADEVGGEQGQRDIAWGEGCRLVVVLGSGDGGEPLREEGEGVFGGRGCGCVCLGVCGFDWWLMRVWCHFDGGGYMYERPDRPTLVA